MNSQLIKDSKLLSSLLEDPDFSIEEEKDLFDLFPMVNFRLVFKFYEDENLAGFNDLKLLELAKNLSFLDCTLLKTVLLSIHQRRIDYSILDDYLIEEIKNFKKFSKISCGQAHSVGLRNDGSIVTWGDNRFNQRLNTPTGTGFVSIACGWNHSVGLKNDGSIVTWGNNSWHQILDTPTV